ncbi:MAG TPA: regulatory protein RecX [Pyrinomonadaceae bacterium]|nr:regulatory protein RecX [Pyrinomonadaceae bacterium]
MQRRKYKPANDENPRASNLTPDERRQKIFARAGKLLAAKPRSVAELRERLLQGRHANVAAVDEVIARLSEYGYLDDERFAVTFASSKVRQKPMGRRRLERDLSLKKVDRAVASEALDAVYAETSEEQLIDLAIEKRLRLRGRPKTRDEAKSLFDHLLRQGFPFELVSDRVRATSRADLDE